MPIALAVAGLIVVAAAIKLGSVIGADAALMYRMLALAVLALAAFAGVWLHHWRKSEALIHARYELKADELKYRKVSLIGRKDARVCAECSALTVDWWTLRDHINWHEQLAVLIAERDEDAPKSAAWTAVTEPGEAQTVTENTPPAALEEEEPRYQRFRDLMERING